MRRGVARLAERFTLAPDDLLRDGQYRPLWLSILTSSFGNQITMLAIPLTAAVLLHATPTQMGLLTAMEIAPPRRIEDMTSDAVSRPPGVSERYMALPRAVDAAVSRDNVRI